MIYAKPGEEFTGFLENAPEGLVGTLATRVYTPSGESVLPRVTTGITEVVAGNYRVARTAPVDPGTYLLIWDKDADGEDLAAADVAVEELRVSHSPAPGEPGAFATPEDVAERLARSLSEAEKEAAASVIATVTGLITDCADRDANWASELDPVPEALKALCVAKAVSAIANPANLASESETLGAYSHSQTQSRTDDYGVFLTPFEERLVSRAVYGTNAGSGTPRSVVDRMIDISEGRGPDEPAPAA